MDTYPRYLKAAKRKHADPASIVEAAATDLTTRQLAQLVSVLRERHGYQVPKGIRDALIDTLHEDGVIQKRISDLLGCHTRTVARRQLAQVGSTNPMDKGCRPDKTEVRDPQPILSFCAAGGGDDCRAIRRVLRDGWSTADAKRAGEAGS